MATTSSTRLVQAGETAPSPGDPVDTSNDLPENRKESPKVSPPSVFVNSEPIREDQVQNAVKFLSHPKVRGSPVMHRRSFLENKGLTKEEIDEAFRRVPDPSPSVQSSNVNQDGRNAETRVPAMSSTQTIQPAAAVASGGLLNGREAPYSRFRWYYAIVAVGVLTVSGVGTVFLIKDTVIPRLKSWIRKVVRQDEASGTLDASSRAKEESVVAAAASATAAAAADLVKASELLMQTRTEEKRYYEEFMQLLDLQVLEMKALSSAIRRLEGQNRSYTPAYAEDENGSIPASHTKPNYMDGKPENGGVLVVNSGPSSSPAKPIHAPHSKSYMEIMAMVQRGERPPNIRDINDQPPNPNQPIPNPSVPPRSKPWEAKARAASSRFPDNDDVYQYEEESSAPWWQRSARISEIEPEREPVDASDHRAKEKNVERAWVPPQPPPVMMPEAAEAIRRPKALPIATANRSASEMTASEDDSRAAQDSSGPEVDVPVNDSGVV